MKQIKAVLIDPVAKKVTEITIESTIEAMYKAMDCDLVNPGPYINDKNDLIYVDDEGMMKPKQCYYEYLGYPHPLAGKSLVVGVNDRGEEVSPFATKESVEANVRFLTAHQTVSMANTHTRQMKADAERQNAAGGADFMIIASPTLAVGEDGFPYITD